MTARLALIEALSDDGLLDRTPTDAGLRVRLRDAPDIEQRTRELVVAESQCCAFLDFDRAATPMPSSWTSPGPRMRGR